MKPTQTQLDHVNMLLDAVGSEYEASIDDGYIVIDNWTIRPIMKPRKLRTIAGTREINHVHWTVEVAVIGMDSDGQATSDLVTVADGLLTLMGAVELILTNSYRERIENTFQDIAEHMDRQKEQGLEAAKELMQEPQL